MTEEEYTEIWKEARSRLTKWTLGYMCQDMNVRHDIGFWVAEVVAEQYEKKIEEVLEQAWYEGCYRCGGEDD